MLTVLALVPGALILGAGLHWWALPIGVLLGAVGGWFVAKVGGDIRTAIMARDARMPSVGQYAYEQTLVAKGKIDQALASFEVAIEREPFAITPRIIAAELYARDRKDHQRAAELLYDAQRISGISTGEDVLVTNRLVLLGGPFADPARVLVERRRLTERHPRSLRLQG